MKKSERQQRIQELIRTTRVQTQGELQQLLASHGVATTQATLSRDIREIPLLKQGGQYIYDMPSGTLNEGHSFLAIHIVPPNLLVIKTIPGSAQSIAYRIDSEKLAHVAGTVAGDDTIMLAIDASQALSTTKHSLARLLTSRRGGLPQ